MGHRVAELCTLNLLPQVAPMQWLQHQLRRVLNRAVASPISDQELEEADRTVRREARRMSRRCAEQQAAGRAACQ